MKSEDRSDDSVFVVKSRKGYLSRQAVIAAAMDIGGREGLTALNVTVITKRAGIGRASFYNYFSSVDELVQTLQETVRLETETALSEVHGLNERGAERFAVCLKLLMQRAAQEPMWGRFMSRVFSESEDAQDMFRAAVRPEIEAAVNAGQATLKPREISSYLNLVTAAVFSDIAKLANGTMRTRDVRSTIVLLLRAGGMATDLAAKN